MSLLQRLATRIEYNWYQPAWKNAWLLPLWLLVVPVVWFKRRRFLHQPPAAQRVPVVVVGNLTVGGTGKTPLITLLVERARALGLTPAVISRGYGGKAAQYPLFVTAETPVSASGDEPALLFRRLQCPVVVDPQRARAALLAAQQADIIFSDDGLQHYALARDAELVVVDGQRNVGNGWLLPVGPLREPLSRLRTVDQVLVNGADFTVEPMALINAHSGELLPLSALQGQRVDAVAGIGNPQRFYRTLQSLGAEVTEHSFADHYAFTAQDFAFSQPQRMLVMTEKDWVKCQSFAADHWWYLQVGAVATPAVQQQLDQLLQRLASGRASCPSGEHHG